MFVLGMIAMAAMQTAPIKADVKAGVDAWQRGDHAAAVSTWRPLAERGDAHAQFNLAQAYKLGRGVPVDMARAIDLYRRAAAQGHEEAGSLLGLILFQNGQRQEAMPYIIKAAEGGEASAQYVYGTALFNGDIVKQDLPRAYAMMMRAAGQGLPPAVSTLAEMDKHLSAADRKQGVAIARAGTSVPVTVTSAVRPGLPPRRPRAPNRAFVRRLRPLPFAPPLPPRA